MAKDVEFRRLTKPGEGVEALSKVGGARLKVGILSGTGEHPNADHGQTLAEIGWWNEFGTRNIPERPFLRPAMRDNLPAYAAIIESSLKAILNRKMTAKRAIGLLGMKAKSDVQHKLTVLVDPPNADATIEIKGSSNTLIDTGALRQHINWAMDEG